jgi:hypothetical protein
MCLLAAELEDSVVEPELSKTESNSKPSTERDENGIPLSWLRKAPDPVFGNLVSLLQNLF